MRAPRLLLLLLALVLATGTACEAPLKPKSSAASRSPSPSGAASPTVGTPTKTRTASPARPGTPRISKPPKLKIPPLPTTPAITGPLLGADISWPQCPRGLGIPEKRTEGLPLPDSSARFVVIGLTNGPGFVANPCLASQVAWARQQHKLVAAYSVISGPTRFSPRGLSGEALGAAQARFNVASMRKVGLETPMVWLDVESVLHFDWGTDKAANAAVVRGAAQAYRAAGYAVGVYSTPYLYASVVGALRLRVPEWRAAGQTSRAEALKRCSRSWVIGGGPGVLAQWVEGGRDRNVTCPGAGDLAAYFHAS